MIYFELQKLRDRETIQVNCNGNQGSISYLRFESAIVGFIFHVIIPQVDYVWAHCTNKYSAIKNPLNLTDEIRHICGACFSSYFRSSIQRADAEALTRLLQTSSRPPWSPEPAALHLREGVQFRKIKKKSISSNLW